jgi:hypothetical protein
MLFYRNVDDTFAIDRLHHTLSSGYMLQPISVLYHRPNVFSNFENFLFPYENVYKNKQGHKTQDTTYALGI